MAVAQPSGSCSRETLNLSCQAHEGQTTGILPSEAVTGLNCGAAPAAQVWSPLYPVLKNQGDTPA